MKHSYLLLLALSYNLSLITTVIEIKDIAAFRKNTLTGNAIVMFTTPTCGPCQIIKPLYKSQSTPHATLYLANVDASNQASMQLAQQFNIRSYPTFLFLKNGKEVSRFITGEEHFLQKFNMTIQKSFQTNNNQPVATQDKKINQEKKKMKKPCGTSCKCPMNKPGSNCCNCGPESCNC